MVTDYDEGDTAELYQKAKNTLPVYQVDTFSLLRLVGDVSGKKVLDVACGEGHFTRLLRQAGAAKVTGLDISTRMIELARQHEARQPLGIEYVVGDASTVADPPQDFELVACAYLMVYARSRAELARMCTGLASRVRPGGRFVTINVNPSIYHYDPEADYRKYGFEVRLADHVYEGAPIDFTVLVGASGLHIRNYYLPIEAYRSELEAAGFVDVAVHRPVVPPEALAAREPGFWDELIDRPVFSLIECVKA
ncbi:MAG: methyltransferase domain-containing protein [Actinomycetia bacterium]|nr:methyltransferase domain-containing protein [Actinomycetes bacterium]